MRVAVPGQTPRPLRRRTLSSMAGPLAGVLLAALLTHAAHTRAEAPAATSSHLDGPAGYSIACAIVKDAGVPGVRSCADLESASRCAREGDFASNPSAQRSGLTIVNRSPQAIKVYWLDRSGVRALYHTIRPGASVGQETRIGAFWVITSGDGQCIGIFSAAPVSIAFF